VRDGTTDPGIAWGRVMGSSSGLRWGVGVTRRAIARGDSRHRPIGPTHRQPPHPNHHHHSRRPAEATAAFPRTAPRPRDHAPVRVEHRPLPGDASSPRALSHEARRAARPSRVGVSSPQKSPLMNRSWFR
jgi:hypothetical protein